MKRTLVSLVLSAALMGVGLVTAQPASAHRVCYTTTSTTTGGSHTYCSGSVSCESVKHSYWKWSGWRWKRVTYSTVECW